MVAGSSSEMVTSDRKNGSSKKLIKGNNELPSSVSTVLSNDDLLIEILLRLPVLSLVLYKSVSKRWLSLIKSPNFITSRNKMSNIDPPSGLLIRKSKRLEFDFYESFDIRIPSKKSAFFTFRFEPPVGRVEVVQSCNGLLLCCIDSEKFYVYNPTIKLGQMLLHWSTSLRLAFDPTKSPHYKVIHTALWDKDDDNNHKGRELRQIITYSSQKGYSVCGDRFPTVCFGGFKEGIYWNGAIHWLNTNILGDWIHYKLEIVNEHPVLTTIQLPETLNKTSRIRFKLFESRGCLLLLGMDYANSQQLNIYEMRNGYSVWSVKYVINLDDIMTPIPYFWHIPKRVWCVVLGEREEDSFMIIDLISKVVQYNPVSKTLCTLSDLEPYRCPFMLKNFDGFQFIPSFAEV